MSKLAVVLAATKGGLDAAVAKSNYKIIPETVRQFASLNTYSDVPFSQTDHINTGGPGWIALAEKLQPGKDSAGKNR